MESLEVVRILKRLEASGIAAWLDGGWGVDALMDGELREHDDLDLVVALVDVEGLIAALRGAGYEHVAGWPPRSFVLVDPAGRQVDVHPVTFDDSRGGGVYVMEDGEEWVYPTEGFSGRGSVAGYSVLCLTPAVQVLAHRGYNLEEKDYRELDLLHERFGVEIPRHG